MVVNLETTTRCPVGGMRRGTGPVALAMITA
jgi:hypothetical protein